MNIDLSKIERFFLNFSSIFYSDFKYVTDPDAVEYSYRFNLYDQPVIPADSKLELNDNINDIHDEINNPDFTFHQFRSNLVAKWEYRPGSLIYLVWSSDRTFSSSPDNSSLIKSMGKITDVFPNNIFLIKLSYWFSL